MSGPVFAPIPPDAPFPDCAWEGCGAAPTRRRNIAAEQSAEAIKEYATWPWLYYCDDHPEYARLSPTDNVTKEEG